MGRDIKDVEANLKKRRKIRNIQKGNKKYGTEM